MKRLAFSLAFLICFVNTQAQLWDELCITDYQTDSASVGILKAEIDALGFFQNNEFSSKVMKGYTLPGAWLQPKLTFAPLPQIRLEAGAHLLLFDGANKYPNFAYHDIAAWKGDQYHHGVHALPFFRAQANLMRVTLVLGDIYGAQNHQLILPLFNPEQNISADPEMGFQLLYDNKHVHLDTWINWQSYIFELETHQEAFTVGLNSTIKWNRNTQKRFQWETPIQLVMQHRGGEQDVTSMGVQTICNAAIGTRMTYRPLSNRFLSNFRAEVDALTSYQQHGTLWPFDDGFAVHVSLRAVMLKHLGVEVGYVGAPCRFANLFGSPFFGTLSTKHKGVTFDGMNTIYTNLNYTYVFSSAYKLGAQLDIYSIHSKHVDALPFGFGVYLHVNPSFVIKGRRAKG